MIWNCLVLLSCVAVTLGSNYRSYYDPVGDLLLENDGLYKSREYDLSGKRNLEKIQDAVGSRKYGNGANEAVRDIAQKAEYVRGENEAAKSSGAQESNYQKGHDRGFYEREKKYGYEKAYGYDRETKQQDRAIDAASQGSGYNQNAMSQKYSQGAEALRDLSAAGNRGQYGAENYADRNILVDQAADRNRGRDVADYYDSRYINRVPYSQQVIAYAPLDYGRGYGGLDGYMGGYGNPVISGLGGLRGYGLGGLGYGKGGYGMGYGGDGYGLGYGKESSYGYGPVKYGYNQVYYSRSGKPYSQSYYYKN